MKNNKPYVLFAFLHSPPTTGMHHLRNFRKVLGRENVISCGAERSGISWDLQKDDSNNEAFGHDVELPKIPHPHFYTYTEVFDLVKSNGFNTDFDLIVIMEPNNAFIVGEDNFRPDCHIAYFAVDTHRSPRDSCKNMTLGRVDSFIYPNDYYTEVFKYPHLIDGVSYIPDKKLILSKTAWDLDIHKDNPEAPDYEKYDIIFLGNDGIDKEYGGAHENFIKANKWAKYLWLDDRGNIKREEGPHPLFNKGCPQDHRFFEYADRAELLCRLREDMTKEFKILAGSLYATDYNNLLNQGKCIINMSIAQDLNMRVAEAMGASRILITDEVVGMDSVCGQNGLTHIRYSKYYNPLNVNFDLCYDIILTKIRRLLSDKERMKTMKQNIKDWVKVSGNSYEDRCELILLETIGWKK